MSRSSAFNEKPSLANKSANVKVNDDEFYWSVESIVRLFVTETSIRNNIDKPVKDSSAS
ncbi:hypothetical protein O9929_27305 [Vibrio lentus]|nr:hypothetical protein [Vibrio lentus]